VGNDPCAVAQSVGINTRQGCQRIAEWAFEYAVRHGRKKVTIVHKANILKVLTGLFLDTGREVGERYRDRLQIEDRIVDNCDMHLVLNPWQFDVILTTNLFGDILSDEIAGLVGGLGMAPGGNIGRDAAIFEAVHGSAPDIAGRGFANPSALLLAAAMMLEHVGEHARAGRLRRALELALADDKSRTLDLGGTATTEQYTDAIIARL
jgi:isocitrate dehydrogenase (NAD+)